MSTQYPVLKKRPINLWKVVELREELKKRKLTTKGLKDDLIKRLHEAIQKEMNDFSSEATAGVSPEPEDLGKSVCGESLSNNAKIVGESGSNSIYGDTNGKGQDTVASVDVGTHTAEVHQPKMQDATIGSSADIQLIEGSLSSKFSVGVSNIMTASIEALENSIVEIDNVVMKSPQKDVDQAEVLKTTLDTHGSFNERATTKITFIEDRFHNDRTKTESEYLGFPLVDTVVIGETEVVEPIMESSRLVKNNEVKQSVLNDKALERSEVELEKDCFNPSRMNIEYDASHTSNQVYKVNTNVGSQVNIESIPTDIVSNNEMKELDDNLIADNAHLELEIDKSEIVQPSASLGPPPDDFRLNLDDHVPHIGEGFVADTNRDNSVNDGASGGLSALSNSAHSQYDDPKVEDVVENNPIEFDTSSNNVGNHVELPEMPTAKDESFGDAGIELSVDNVKTYVVDSPRGAGSAEEEILQDGRSTSPDANFGKMAEDRDEKINIDQTLDDDSFDNVVEMNDDQVLHMYDEVSEKIELTQVPGVKTSNTFVTTVPDSSFSKLDCSLEKMDKTAVSSEKRKARDEAAVDCEGHPKRQRNWNFEDHNIPEQLGSGAPGYTRVADDSSHATLPKCNLPLSDTTHSKDAPKERIVPPSSKTPTNSLRIDQFLRPFTLKAVQELLAKTGEVCSFWMDNIKTHCYVTYSSVEEAIETRNAIYNLQWPPNGERFLLAEFADPEEVKTRSETHNQPTPAHITTVPNGTPTQASVQPPKQKDLRQHIRPKSPPPLPEKVDSPIGTLDDLFRKTRTKPQIYYLPLTKEQVADKKANRSKRRVE